MKRVRSGNTPSDKPDIFANQGEGVQMNGRRWTSFVKILVWWGVDK